MKLISSLSIASFRCPLQCLSRRPLQSSSAPQGHGTTSVSGGVTSSHAAVLGPSCKEGSSHLISHLIIIYPLTVRVVGAPQMILQPVLSIFPCFPLPSGTSWTPGQSIPWCCLPTSSSVCLVFFPLSLCLARWFWPDLMNGRHDHTAGVCVSLWWSGGLRVVRLPAGSWHGLPHC